MGRHANSGMFAIRPPAIWPRPSTASICPQSIRAAWRTARATAQSGCLSGQCGFQAAATFSPGTAQGWNCPRATSRRLHTAQDRQGRWRECIAEFFFHHLGVRVADAECDERSHIAKHRLSHRQRKLVNVLMRKRESTNGICGLPPESKQRHPSKNSGTRQ